MKIGSKGVITGTLATKSMKKGTLKEKINQVWNKEILLANINGRTSEVHTTTSGTYAVSDSGSVVVDSRSLYIPTRITEHDFNDVVFDGRIIKHNPKPRRINYIESSEFAKYYKDHRITDTITGILYRSARLKRQRFNLIDHLTSDKGKERAPRIKKKTFKNKII